jgi:hypothetical protein
MRTLVPFGPEIWTAEGPVVSFFGFAYPTRMVVIRLKNGSLFVWSPIALTAPLKAEVDALGPVAHLVSPNKIHHLFLQAWRQAYPQARLYAPPGLKARRRDLFFDAELGDTPDPAWKGEIDLVAFVGSFAMTEIVFFHRASRTAIFADLIENFPPDWFKGWRAIPARLIGIVQPCFGTPRDWGVTFWQRGRTRRALAEILDFGPENAIVAHGDMVRGGAEAFIRKAFSWLEPKWPFTRRRPLAKSPSPNRHQNKVV